jgi:hypothetical protein
MGADFNIRPVGAPVGRSASGTANDAVATELPAAQSVTAADASARERDSSNTASAYLSRRAFDDRAAASIVYQVVDVRTDQVLQQFPDEAVLRRRAYFRALDLAERAPKRVLVTDRKA